MTRSYTERSKRIGYQDVAHCNSRLDRKRTPDIQANSKTIEHQIGNTKHLPPYGSQLADAQRHCAKQ